MSTEIVNKQIKLNNVRLLRVSLTKQYVGKDAKIDPATGKAEGKFHIDAVFPPSHPQFPELQALIRGVAQAKWQEQTQQTLDMIKGNNQRFPLVEEPQRHADLPASVGHPGHPAARCRNPRGCAALSPPARPCTSRRKRASPGSTRAAATRRSISPATQAARIAARMS